MFDQKQIKTKQRSTLSFVTLALCAIFIFTNFGQLFSQSHCGYNDMYDPFMLEDGFKEYMNEQIDDIKKMAKYIKKSNDRMPIEIPVVVHIVHEGEAVGTGNNILYQDVVDAIDRLNLDFDASGIQYCLAVRDEEGNQLAEPGVVRVDASSNSDYVANGVSLGGQTEYDIKALGPIFDSYLYFNIWVVKNLVGYNSAGQIQGVGTFPNTVGPERDGVMMRHSIFNLSTNRVLTHEAGHYLGLFHTFQGDDADYDGVADQCPSATADFPDSDEISDTQPHMRSPSLTCPSGPNSCSSGDLLEDISNNHMDYSSEACRVEFTDEQNLHMQATVMELREGLMISLGCDPVECDPVFTVDFTVDPEFPVAPDDNGLNAEPGVFTASQSGSHEWFIDGVSLSTASSYTHDFDEPGYYNVCLSTEEVNNCVIQTCKIVLVFDAGLCFNPTLEPCQLLLNGDATQVNEDAIWEVVTTNPNIPEETYHFFPGSFNHLDVICNWTNYIPDGGEFNNPAWLRFSNGEVVLATNFIENNPFPLKEGFGTVEELDLVEGVQYELTFEYLIKGNYTNFYFALSDQMGQMDNSATKIYNSGQISGNASIPPNIDDVFLQSGSIPFTYSASDGKFLYYSADLLTGETGLNGILVKNISVKGCDEVCDADPFFTYDNVCGEFEFTGIDANPSSNGIVSWRINGITVPQSLDLYNFDFSFPYEGFFDVCMDVTCPNGTTVSYCEEVFAGGTFTVGSGGGQIACEICQNPETFNVDAQRCGANSDEYLIESFPFSVPKGWRPCLENFGLTLGYGGDIDANDYYVDESDPLEDVIYVSFTYTAVSPTPSMGGLFAACSPDGTESLCYQFLIDNFQTCDQCGDDQSIISNMSVICVDDDITDGVIEYDGSFVINTPPNSQPCGDISPHAGLVINSLNPTSSTNESWNVGFTISTNQLGTFNTTVSLCFIDGNGDKICYEVQISITDSCIPGNCIVNEVLGKLKCNKVEGTNAIYNFSALAVVQELFDDGYVFCDEDPVTGVHVNSADSDENQIFATQGVNSYIFGTELIVNCLEVKNIGLTTINLNLCKPDGSEECISLAILLECPECGSGKSKYKGGDTSEFRGNESLEHIVYPVPATDMIRVKSPESKNSQRYTIYAASSRLISAGILTSGINEITTDQLPNGIYYMKIENGDDVFMKKFIIID